MIPTRAALGTAAAVLVLSGCGVAAAVTARTTTVADVTPAKTVEISATPLRSLPRPAVVPATNGTPPASTPPKPTAAASSAFLVVTADAGAGKTWLEILSQTGAMVARTEISPTLQWLVSAGPGGAYWAEGGSEYVLSTSGKVRRLGALPASANGVLISPDGTEYAYATSESSANSMVSTNKIVVVRSNGSAVTIADRISDPNHPTADAPPNGWDYYLINWTSTGIAFARVPTGGCGCGLFDMQMQSGYAATINPVTEVVTPITEDQSCPLSAVGPGGQDACFAASANADGTGGLRVSVGGTQRYSFAMSGANFAGDAQFSPTGTSIAYITVPSAEDSCGASWTATLRVLNLASGKAVSRALGEFSPVLWAPNGLIYGNVESADASGNYSSTLVAVNPATLAVTHLGATGADSLVGMV
jgi:hypothetical protein